MKRQICTEAANHYVRAMCTYAECSCSAAGSKFWFDHCVVFSTDLLLYMTTDTSCCFSELLLPLHLQDSLSVPHLCLYTMFVCPSVRQCPEKNARPPHMRAFNKAVAVVFNSSGDDNCGLRDGLLVKATAVRLDFRAVIAAC